MSELIKKIKYEILRPKIKYPLLHIVDDMDFEELSSKNFEFVQRDVVLPKDLYKLNKKYEMIVLDGLTYFPTEILSIISQEGEVYFFTDNYDLDEELLKYFHFVKNNVLTLNLGVYPKEITDSFVDISLNGEKSINLLTASNKEVVKINHRTNISMRYINFFIERNFVKRGLLNKEIELRKTILGKQKIIKKALDDLFKKLSDTEKKLKFKNYEVKRLRKLLKNFLINENHLNINTQELKLIDELIQKNIELLEKEIFFEKRILELKLENKESNIVLKFESGIDKDEVKKLYKENKELIEQNNLYVSEISNLKFDLEEIQEKNNELLKVIEELENQLLKSESEKEKEFKELRSKYEAQKERLISDFKSEKKSLEKKIEFLNEKIEKLGDKNLKNLKVIDEKNSLIQKLKLKLENLQKELELKDELINKKNMQIREMDNKIALLDDEIKNKDLKITSLNKELKENRGKLSNNYYKDLYDNLEKKFNNLKSKNGEYLKRINDYKKEIEQYEMKLQELMGYNERMLKDIEIDIDF